MKAGSNEIAQIKTVGVSSPEGPVSVMMIALNVGDPTAAETFVSEVASQFRLHRTLAPPDTSVLLISMIGDLPANKFVEYWKSVTRDDGVARAYISLMRLADVVQITKTGEERSKASLLSNDSSE